MNRELQVKIIKEGIVQPGVIISCQSKRYPSDTEYEEFFIDYVYEYHNEKFNGKNNFLINTDHLSWANSGSLIGFPKITFTRNDILKALKKGTKIKVYVLPEDPNISLPEYDEIIYNASEL